MEEKKQGDSRMMTIRQVAQTGLFREGTLRTMSKANQLPQIFVGKRKKVLIDFDKLLEQLNSL